MLRFSSPANAVVLRWSGVVAQGFSSGNRREYMENTWIHRVLKSSGPNLLLKRAFVQVGEVVVVLLLLLLGGEV